MSNIEKITAFKVGSQVYESFDTANAKVLSNRLNALFCNCNASLILTNIIEIEEVREELMDILVDFNNAQIEEED